MDDGHPYDGAGATQGTTGGAGSKDPGGGGAGGGAPGMGGGVAAGGTAHAGGAHSASGGSGGGANPGSGGAGVRESGGGPSTGGADTGTGGVGSLVPTAYQDNCQLCHGPDGGGDPVEGPPIWGATEEMMSYLVRDGDANETVNNMGQIVGHPKTMDPFSPSAVSDEDMVAIMDWLIALPKPTQGAELFAQYCSFCHGASGKGGDTEYATAYHSAPFPRQDLTSFTTYVKAGHASENGVTIDPSERRKYMPPFAGVLSDSELALIFSWAKAQ